MPVPDPTKLTTEAVERTTAQFQRELTNLREILEAQVKGAINSGHLRMDSIEKYTALLAEQHSQIRRELQEKTDNLEDVAKRVRVEISEEISHSRELTALLRVDLLAEISHIREVRDEKFENITTRFDERNVWLHEKFNGLALQFQERDVRTAQAAVGSRQALEASLDAAKELVGQQNSANAAAAAKAEASTTKQIDQLLVVVQTLEKAVAARIEEIKERIDRGEGASLGSRETHTEHRLNQSAIVAFVVACILGIGMITSVVALILKK